MSPESGPDGSERALDAYAAQAAHQLGEAVALMRAATTVLGRQRGAADAGDALRGMQAGVDRAQRFVDDLLELTAVNHAELLAEEIDLAVVVEDVRRDLDEVLARAKATLRADALPVVCADRRQVRRLVAHLVRVALAAGARTVEVTARAGDDGATLEVSDDGMPPDAEIADPFAPFARARGRGPLVGAGVSLTVCRRIARLHGGEVALQHRGDAATVVTVTLPAPGAAGEPAAGELVRVLLCDDAPELRALLRAELDTAPAIAVVGEAGDGHGAVVLAGETTPDIVVLDLEMPGPEPGELLERLRAAAPSARLVTFSGHDPWMAGPDAEDHIALHVPKTTELSAVHRAIADLARRTRAL